MRSSSSLRIAEDAFPGRIQAEEVAVEAGDAEQIERQREERFELLAGPLPLDVTWPIWLPTVVIVSSRSGAAGGSRG